MSGAQVIGQECSVCHLGSGPRGPVVYTGSFPFETPHHEACAQGRIDATAAREEAEHKEKVERREKRKKGSLKEAWARRGKLMVGHASDDCPACGRKDAMLRSDICSCGEDLESHRDYDHCRNCEAPIGEGAVCPQCGMNPYDDEGGDQPDDDFGYGGGTNWKSGPRSRAPRRATIVRDWHTDPTQLGNDDGGQLGEDDNILGVGTPSSGQDGSYPRRTPTTDFGLAHILGNTHLEIRMLPRLAGDCPGCANSVGTGKCSRCDGEGTLPASEGGDTCPKCGGSGDCQTCFGTGEPKRMRPQGAADWSRDESRAPRWLCGCGSDFATEGELKDHWEREHPDQGAYRPHKPQGARDPIEESNERQNAFWRDNGGHPAVGHEDGEGACAQCLSRPAKEGSSFCHSCAPCGLCNWPHGAHTGSDAMQSHIFQPIDDPDEERLAQSDFQVWNEKRHGSSRTAGPNRRRYTPLEKAALIDEEGEAGNADKISLQGTHYERFGPEEIAAMMGQGI